MTLEWFRARVGSRTSEWSPSFFGGWLDGRLLVADEGHFVVEFEVRQEMTNPAGILHGGAVAGMVDDVFGMLAATLGGERYFVTVNLHVDYLGSARLGDTLVVDARILRKGATLMHAEASLRSGERLLARASTNMVVGRIERRRPPAEAQGRGEG